MDDAVHEACAAVNFFVWRSHWGSQRWHL